MKQNAMTAGRDLTVAMFNSVEQSTKQINMSEQQQKRVLDFIEPIIEEGKEGAERDDDSDQAKRPVERKLDELNQTQDLMNKIKAKNHMYQLSPNFDNEPPIQSSSSVEKVSQYLTDKNKNYIEDGKDDRKHLVQYKNLPSIRDKLLSLKSKQQLTLIDPKYNIVNRKPSHNTIKNNAYKTLGDYETSQPGLMSTNSKYGIVRSRHSMSGGAGPLPFGKKKNYQQLMQELTVIAKDLEMYNASKMVNHFNERARSMVFSG